MRSFALLTFMILVALTTTIGAKSRESFVGQPIRIVLDRSCERGLVIEIDSIVVASPHLLNELGALLQKRGRSTPVFVLAKKAVAIEDLQYIRAISGKVGLNNVRFFSFDPTRGIASEISLEMLGVPVPELLAETSKTE